MQESLNIDFKKREQKEVQSLFSKEYYRIEEMIDDLGSEDFSEYISSQFEEMSEEILQRYKKLRQTVDILNEKMPKNKIKKVTKQMIIFNEYHAVGKMKDSFKSLSSSIERTKVELKIILREFYDINRKIKIIIDSINLDSNKWEEIIITFLTEYYSIEEMIDKFSLNDSTINIKQIIKKQLKKLHTSIGNMFFFEKFSKGIHIEKITEADLKDVLDHHYGIKEFKEDSMLLLKDYWIRGSKSLECIFDLTLKTLEINGIYPKDYNLDEDDKTTYFNDIITLIYLYITNIEKPLSVNTLDASSQTQVKMFYIENSGFGNVLGIRRESNRMVQYIVKNNNEKQQKYQSEIIRRERTKKYNIPYPCKDIITILLTTMKHNPFLFMSEKDETYSEEECEELDYWKLYKMIFGEKMINEIPLLNTKELGMSIFKDELIEPLKKIAVSGGGMLEKLKQYEFDAGKNVDENYKFYNSFFNKLIKIEDTEYSPKYCTSGCRKKINYYLFELLFAYSFYVEIFQFINKTYADQYKDAEYWNIINKISQMPACYTRKKQAKRFTEDYFSGQDKKRIIHREEFMMETFLPAMYYCFLYYIKSMGIIGKDDKIREGDIEAIGCCLTDAEEKKIKPSQFKTWLNSAEAKQLWNRRRLEYFRPLDYIYENALF